MATTVPLEWQTFVSGAQEDVTEIIKRFVQQSSIRYSDFTEIWRQMKFSFLCCGKYDDLECGEFLNYVYQLILCMMAQERDLQRKIGLLYTLYGVYNTQPVYPAKKIRITPEQWQVLMELQTIFKEQEHLDSEYLLLSLIKNKVFIPVLLPNEVLLPRYRNSGDSKPFTSRVEFESMLTRVFDADSLESLAAIHSEYQNSKRPSIRQENDVIHDDLVSTISKSLEDAQSGVYIKTKEIKEEDFSESVGSRRQALKNRAFEAQASPGRQRRRGKTRDKSRDKTRETTYDSDEDDDTLAELRSTLMSSKSSPRSKRKKKR